MCQHVGIDFGQASLLESGRECDTFASTLLLSLTGSYEKCSGNKERSIE